MNQSSGKHFNSYESDSSYFSEFLGQQLTMKDFVALFANLFANNFIINAVACWGLWAKYCDNVYCKYTHQSGANEIQSLDTPKSTSTGRSLGPRYTQKGQNSQNPRTLYMIYLQNVQCAARHELHSHYLNYKV